MKISVVIVTKNHPNLLKRSINSIFEGTKYPNELIIIDNSTNNQTKKIIEKNRHKDIIQYKKAKGNLSQLRNQGLKLAKYEIVAFTDDDCVVHKNWIKNIIESHKKNKQMAIGGLTKNYYNNKIGYIGHLFIKYMTIRDLIKEGESDKYRNYEKLLENKHFARSLATQNISYKRNKILQIRFKENIPYIESVDLSWRLYNKDHKSILYDPNIIVYHEYEKTIKNLLQKHLIYGKYSKNLVKIAANGGYLPAYYSNRNKGYFSDLFNYVKFIFKEISREDFKPHTKIPLCIFALTREVSFIIGFIKGTEKNKTTPNI